MSFGREARRVRDPALPLRYRIHALGSCITLAQPLGFHATWAYLEKKVQRPWRDPEFLLPAVGLLVEERMAHLRVNASYVQSRRAQKAAGLRFPPRCDVTPSDPYRWHGDERVGARLALQGLRASSDEAIARHALGRRVLVAIDGALDGDGADTTVMELQEILDWARRQVHVIGWESDRSEYRIAWQIYRRLGQLHVLQNGAIPVATPWNFETS